MNKKFKFTESEIKELYEKHLTGVSCVDLAKEEKVNQATILNSFKRFGLVTRRFSRKKNTIIYDNFFDKIDTEIKAYLLGFIAADGNIYKHKHSESYYLNVSVHEKDLYIIQLLQMYISPTVKIQHKPEKKQVKIAICSKKLFDSLYMLGIVPNKTYKEIHTIALLQDNVKPHFIRGFFDGDGTIGKYTTHTNKNRDLYSFNIVSKRGLVLTHILKEFKISASITYFISKDVFNLSTLNRKDILKIKQYLYTNANFYFTRKRDIFTLAEYELNTEISQDLTLKAVRNA